MLAIITKLYERNFLTLLYTGYQSFIETLGGKVEFEKALVKTIWQRCYILLYTWVNLGDIVSLRDYERQPSMLKARRSFSVKVFRKVSKFRQEIISKTGHQFFKSRLEQLLKRRICVGRSVEWLGIHHLRQHTPSWNKGAAGGPFCFGTVKVVLSPRAERAQSNPYAVTAEECKR